MLVSVLKLIGRQDAVGQRVGEFRRYPDFDHFQPDNFERSAGTDRPQTGHS